MCGIFAWTGDSNKKFNWDKFNILGILNNSRGGDSCGRVSGNISQYGTEVESDYNKFLEKHNSFPMKEKVIIGHDRKASFGYVINEENAQPVTIKEGDQIVFTLAHNGTIHNIKDLADKYGIKYTNETDSWILANILYTYGYDVLSEYYGAATLIMHDRKAFLETGDTIIRIFKGASKNTEYAKEMYEERPLFIYTRVPGSIYFSSLENSLVAIGGNNKTVKNLPCNIVLTFKNGVFQEDESVEIDRSAVYQTKPISKSTYYNYDYYNDNYYNHKQSSFNWEKKDYDIDAEFISSAKDLVNFKKGRYYCNNLLMDGIFYISKYGYLDNTIRKPFYFINGLMINDQDAYNRALKEIKDLRYSEQVDILCNYSVTPVYIQYAGTKTGYFYWSDSAKNKYLFNGSITPIFSSYKYEINHGKCIKTIYLTDSERNYPDYTLKQLPENTKYKEDLMEEEVSNAIACLLQYFEDTKEIIENFSNNKVLINNLDLILDSFFYEKEGKLYDHSLKLDLEWKKPF